MQGVVICGNLTLFCGFEIHTVDVPLPRAACTLPLIAVQHRATVRRCYKYW